VLHAVTRKATQNLLCLGSAQTQGCREFDHFVILLPDEFPFNRAREHRLQVWVVVRVSRFRTIELLGMQILQAGQELKAQQGTESKPDFRLSVGIDLIALDLHF